MNKIKWLAPSLLALCVASAGALKAHSLEVQPVPNASLAQDHDHDQNRWDEPPSDYRDAQRRGFHEGVEAARHDMSENRHADVDDHQTYKRPPVDRDDRRAFREGFREGYRRAMEHMRHDHDDQPHR